MFEKLTKSEMMEVNGGIVPIVITGAMVIKGIGVLAAGVTFGTIIGKTIKAITD